MGRLSANPPERPGLRYAIDRIENGDATHLAVLTPTALGRSEAHVDEVRREIRARGARSLACHDGRGRKGAPPASRLIVNQPVSPAAALAARQMIGSLTPTVSGSKRHEFMLAATEVVNNAVVHAAQRGDPDGDIRVEIAVSEVRMRLAVRDHGTGMEAPTRPSPGDDERVGGWGLYIVDAIADKWGHRTRPDDGVAGGGAQLIVTLHKEGGARWGASAGFCVSKHGSLEPSPHRREAEGRKLPQSCIRARARLTRPSQLGR